MMRGAASLGADVCVELFDARPRRRADMLEAPHNPFGFNIMRVIVRLAAKGVGHPITGIMCNFACRANEFVFSVRGEAAFGIFASLFC